MTPFISNPAVFASLFLFLISKEELRFQSSYKQEYESSCGLAAAAGALNFYWGIPVAEEELARVLYREAADSGENSSSLSLQSLKELLETEGLLVRGYRLSSTELRVLIKDFAPILVYFSEPEAHFLLLLAVAGDLWVVSDPAAGTTVLSRTDFDLRFGKAALVMQAQGKQADSFLLASESDRSLERYNLLEKLQ